MGFLERFVGRQKNRNEKGDASDSNVNRLGMSILSDEKLLVRLGVYDDMFEMIQKLNVDSPSQTLQSIEGQAHKINSMLHQVAIPFGRAGDRGAYAEAMRGWSTLFTKMVDMIQAAKTLNEKWKGSETEKRELVEKVFHYYQSVYLRYALLIAEISWYGEDVIPSWSGVIMQPMPVNQPRPSTSFQNPRDLNEEMNKGG